MLFSNDEDNRKSSKYKKWKLLKNFCKRNIPNFKELDSNIRLNFYKRIRIKFYNLLNFCEIKDLNNEERKKVLLENLQEDIVWLNNHSIKK